MFFRRELRADPEFRAGMRDMWPQAPGIAAWGLMTGVAMVKSGMSGVESLLMALLVFAGSSQLAAIPLLVAGAPAWVILATGFCVNLRFVVFSLHLRPYLMHLPLWQRLTHGYLTADISYVLFTRRFPVPAQEGDGGHEVTSVGAQSAAPGRSQASSAPLGGREPHAVGERGGPMAAAPGRSQASSAPLGLRAAAPGLPAQGRTARRDADSGSVSSSAVHEVTSVGARQLAQEAYLAGNCFVNWGSWVSASVAGVALANFIPTHWGLGFAGILCLVGILSSLATTRLRVLSAAVAGAAAVAAHALPLKLNIVVAIAVAVLICLTVEKPLRAMRGAS
jgi:predicted branched-subunit amino acid permease